MRKYISVFVAVALLFSLAACSDGSKKAFEASKIAYNNVDIAYGITEQFGDDVYAAWHAGIYDEEELFKKGVAYLATELHLSEDELKEGVYYVVAGLLGEMSDKDKALLTNNTAGIFKIMEDELFSFCVRVVTSAYIVNGKVEEAQTALNIARTQMKELGSEYSDYEHYASLKEYYTTTVSFFEFCQNPTGSFEQIKITINDYTNKIRDCKMELDYIFED